MASVKITFTVSVTADGMVVEENGRQLQASRFQSKAGTKRGGDAEVVAERVQHLPVELEHHSALVNNILVLPEGKRRFSSLSRCL